MTDAKQPRLLIRPCTLKRAHQYVKRHHRHHEPKPGGLWACAVMDAKSGLVYGVAVVGIADAPALNDGRTIEMTRSATDGTPNACSCLLGAVGRYARLWKLRAVTYTLPDEGGISLKAAGWKFDGYTEPHGGVGWANRPGRKYDHPEVKSRWILDARDDSPDLVWPDLPEEPEPQLSLLSALMQQDPTTPKESS